jgi:hypothetical protein
MLGVGRSRGVEMVVLVAAVMVVTFEVEDELEMVERVESERGRVLGRGGGTGRPSLR